MYIFRAWIDERGFNEDRVHARWCGAPGTNRRCDHLRLVDLNSNRSHRNIVRVVRGHRTLHILLGKKFHRILHIGRG